MKIGWLVKSKYFDFNAPYRVIEYNLSDETICVYDSVKSHTGIPRRLANKEIGDIHTGSDGVLEIQFYDEYDEEE